MRESIYGILCQSPIAVDQVNCGNGTAFMIAPGVCATAAHVLHVEGDKSKPLHKKIEVIRTPDIGTPMAEAKLIAEDIDRDLALIEIINPVNLSIVTLYPSIIERGTTRTRMRLFSIEKNIKLGNKKKEHKHILVGYYK